MKNILLLIGILLTVSCNFLNGENEKVIYLCEESDNFRDLILESAVKRELNCAMEGIEREIIAEEEFSMIIKNRFGTEGKAFIYGVEDPRMIIFQAALTLNNVLRSAEKRHSWTEFTRTTNSRTKKSDILCPLVHKSNQKFLDEFWSNKKLIGNPIFDYLKANKNRLMKKALLAQILTLEPQIKKWKDSDWVEFTQEVALILAPMIEKLLPGDKLEALTFLLTCLEDFELKSNCDAEEESLFFMRTLHLDLRNHFIIKNLEEIYSLSNKEKRTTVCILDHSRIDGVRAGLEKKGFRVLGRKEFLREKRKSEL